jgi:hypothetical protein
VASAAPPLLSASEANLSIVSGSSAVLALMGTGKVVAMKSFKPDLVKHLKTRQFIVHRLDDEKIPALLNYQKP